MTKGQLRSYLTDVHRLLQTHPVWKDTLRPMVPSDLALGRSQWSVGARFWWAGKGHNHVIYFAEPEGVVRCGSSGTRTCSDTQTLHAEREGFDALEWFDQACQLFYLEDPELTLLLGRSSSYFDNQHFDE